MEQLATYTDMIVALHTRSFYYTPKILIFNSIQFINQKKIEDTYISYVIINRRNVIYFHILTILTKSQEHTYNIHNTRYMYSMEIIDLNNQ